ncbi:hypothetical protein Spirs_0002 [Sediminispirochaeta smaragdinae DSM 11293]|jgi:hypothetical protein|uniref:Uncharacterized protein n=1 Tax=Sediminispirochaeta smaragdinae (strain DSM 11293 / JCM 15392 / SEBR 4228) TaxID=573413 RepID=E1R6N0_SEDSS|nr:hypothetical protein Spirs_0002 [Sediminispirochaeta smaragdinae DSM 11293]
MKRWYNYEEDMCMNTEGCGYVHFHGITFTSYSDGQLFLSKEIMADINIFTVPIITTIN